MKDKRFLANVDKDALCFAFAVLIMMGIGAVVAMGRNGNAVKPMPKKENILDKIKSERDTINVQEVNILDLISVKQK